MKIKVLPSASQDLVDGYRFYEKQSSGLGSYFKDTLFSDIDSLSIYGGIHPVHYGKYYRLLSKRFPFAVYYTIQHDVVCVFAVLDCRRKPAWIRNKLKRK
ncbi:helicase [Candidatus Scalindua japonica]|uniref:Helicase n=1 Tax=Candidatus Scalindua japonica TaxID=1284222 RepID=A0A286U2R4_9BACT|nr:type II toxin-antitoxin system RelE/ParE family toxin [Candidatus Scalindua japonica]GAX62361.1 helicase [Candidatus Scalindua japonica]